MKATGDAAKIQNLFESVGRVPIKRLKLELMNVIQELVARGWTADQIDEALAEALDTLIREYALPARRRPSPTL